MILMSNAPGTDSAETIRRANARIYRATTGEEPEYGLVYLEMRCELSDIAMKVTYSRGIWDTQVTDRHDGPRMAGDGTKEWLEGAWNQAYELVRRLQVGSHG